MSIDSNSIQFPLRDNVLSDESDSRAWPVWPRVHVGGGFFFLKSGERSRRAEFNLLVPDVLLHKESDTFVAGQTAGV